MPVLKYSTDNGATWLPLTPGPPGPPGAPGPDGDDGGTMWVQPAPPVVSQKPAGYPLWLDTDDTAGVGLTQTQADARYVQTPPTRAFAIANTAGGWSGDCPVDKQGSMCSLIINCAKGTWAGSEVICTLPVGYRPGQSIYFTGLNGNSGAYNFGYIQANGAVVVGFAATGGGSFLGNITFFTPY